MALTHFISLREAAQKMRMSTTQIRELVESGKIEGGILPDGKMVVTEESLPLRKEDLPEYKKHAHLKGEGISISDASREFNIPAGTITRWMQSGIVSRLSSDGYRTFIDKADIAYCAEIYHRVGKQGRTLFNSDGTPYKSKKSR